MFRPEHNYKDFFAAAVLGGTLGAVTALMFTEKGKKIQKELMHKYQAMGNQINSYRKAAAKQWKKPIVKKAVRKVMKKAKKAKSSPR